MLENISDASQSVEYYKYSTLKNLYDNVQQKFIEARKKHADDIQLIGDALIEKAKEQNWCSEYDSFIEKLNDKLHIELPTRTDEYEMEFIVTRTISQTVTLTVTASSDTEAEEIAIEKIQDELSSPHNRGKIVDLDMDAWEVEDEEIKLDDFTRS
jgi:L-lactate utilization protein LutC